MKKNYLFILMLCTNVLFAQKWNGLTLIGPSMVSTLKLVDTNSTVVKTINCTGGSNTYANYLTKGGDFYRTVAVNTGLIGGGMHGKIQRYNWSGNLTWEYTLANTTEKLHHDFCVLPNGNVLLICYDVKNAGVVTAAGGTFSQTAWYEKIIEVQPTGATTGTIVWQWNLWDRNCQSTNSNLTNYVSNIANHPERFHINLVGGKDFCHMNGIDFDNNRNQIVLSSHFLNEVYIIDHSTTTAEAATHIGGTSGKGGDFLYRYGRPTAYGATGANAIDVVHDGHLVKQGPYKDYIAFFHNKGNGANSSAADLILPPRNGNTYTITSGSAYTPTAFSKRILALGYSSNMGSVEEFPNGNFMISVATSGSVKEFDSTGNILWSYSTGGSCAQAHRFNMCDISIVKPNIPTISLNGSTLSISNPNNYGIQWMLNGLPIAGATSTSLDAGANFGEFSVSVKDSFFCVVNSTTKGVYSLGTESIIAKNITVYPNPANEILTIDGIDFTNTKSEICIVDLQGKLCYHKNGTNKINIANLSNGLYSIQVRQNNQLIYSNQFEKN